MKDQKGILIITPQRNDKQTDTGGVTMDRKEKILAELEKLDENEREEVLKMIREKYMQPETWWDKGGGETYEEW
ncbi:hypothetical protein SAMN05421758_101250 [Salimicrobium salexigens]|uniref:Uncharacterized protein n=1 Tax=Salimicrobium salexigens TaxID=908941 RepID=A0ABY1KKM2_9BACI|nr:hypothetical protein SAMN05421758_101250 [Salimicrobium salexigens]